jgi:hypothetical protein
MLIRAAMGAFFALGAIGAALAQNSFPTPGGATVPGYVNMCIVGNLAVPCNPSGGGGGFTGPGDTVSGALAWWGLRAYSSATAGTKAANICNASSVCADVNTLAANGNFDVATAQGAPLNCGGTGGTCTVNKLYDQSGASNCTGPCDEIGSTPFPTLVFNCLGTKPCAAFAASPMQSPAYVPTTNQPFTGSAVATRTGNLTAYGDIIANAGGGIQLMFGQGNNLVSQYASGSIPSASAADNAPHAMQFIVNGATGSFFIDGVSTAVGSNPGPGPITGNLDVGGNANNLAGNFFEGGFWAFGFSGAQQSSMNTNQHTYWGF